MATVHRLPPAPQPQLYRFSGLDLATLGLYVAITGIFAAAGDLVAPFLRDLAPSPAAASYAVTVLFYASVGMLALLAADKVVGRDLRVVGKGPWFTLLMLPPAV